MWCVWGTHSQCVSGVLILAQTHLTHQWHKYACCECLCVAHVRMRALQNQRRHIFLAVWRTWWAPSRPKLSKPRPTWLLQVLPGQSYPNQDQPGCCRYSHHLLCCCRNSHHLLLGTSRMQLLMGSSATDSPINLSLHCQSHGQLQHMVKCCEHWAKYLECKGAPSLLRPSIITKSGCRAPTGLFHWAQRPAAHITEPMSDVLCCDFPCTIKTADFRCNICVFILCWSIFWFPLFRE